MCAAFRERASSHSRLRGQPGRFSLRKTRRPRDFRHAGATSTALLALAMSTDAFAAAVGKGAGLNRPRFAEALRTGAIFGVIEATTPLVGWALGLAAAR